jgi:hypothetical protein
MEGKKSVAAGGGALVVEAPPFSFLTVNTTEFLVCMSPWLTQV